MPFVKLDFFFLYYYFLFILYYRETYPILFLDIILYIHLFFPVLVLFVSDS